MMSVLSTTALLLLILSSVLAQNKDTIPKKGDPRLVLEHQPISADLKLSESTADLYSYYNVPFAYRRQYSPNYGYYFPYSHRPYIGYGYRPYVGLKAFLPYGVPLYG